MLKKTKRVNELKRNIEVEDTGLLSIKKQDYNLPWHIWAEVSAYLNLESMLSLTTTSHSFLNVRRFILQLRMNQMMEPIIFKRLSDFSCLRFLTITGIFIITHVPFFYKHFFDIVHRYT
jgi:hypothetical protein